MSSVPKQVYALLKQNDDGLTIDDFRKHFGIHTALIHQALKRLRKRTTIVTLRHGRTCRYRLPEEIFLRQRVLKNPAWAEQYKILVRHHGQAAGDAYARVCLNPAGKSFKIK